MVSTPTRGRKQPSRAGWLEKRGSGLLRNVWHKRFFELQGRGLRWLLAPGGEERGRTPLTGATVAVSNERRNSFTITTPHLRRPLVLSALNPEDLSMWVAACQAAVELPARSSSCGPSPRSAEPVSPATSVASERRSQMWKQVELEEEPPAYIQAVRRNSCPALTKESDPPPPPKAPRINSNDLPAHSDPTAPSEDSDRPFRQGEWVEVRDDGREWREGVVTDVEPLKVQPVGWDAAYEWHEVRRMGDGEAERWRHPNLLKQELRRLQEALAEAQAARMDTERRSSQCRESELNELRHDLAAAQSRAQAAEKRAQEAMLDAQGRAAEARRAEDQLRAAAQKTALLEAQRRGAEQQLAAARVEAAREGEERRRRPSADMLLAAESKADHLTVLVEQLTRERNELRKKTEAQEAQRAEAVERENSLKRQLHTAEETTARLLRETATQKLADERDREAIEARVAAAVTDQSRLREDVAKRQAAAEARMAALEGERDLVLQAEKEAAGGRAAAEAEVERLRMRLTELEEQTPKQDQAEGDAGDSKHLASQVWTLERALELRNEEITRLRTDVESLASRHERIQAEQKDGERELQRMRSEVDRLAQAQAQVASFGVERKRWEAEKEKLQQEAAKGGRMAAEDRWLRQRVSELTRERDVLLAQIRATSQERQPNQQQPRNQPQQSRPRSWYDELGTRPDASQAELKAAFHSQALRWHPDKWTDRSSNEQAAAEARFKELNKIYSTLRDPMRRREYDRRLHNM
eukprot:Hpha_TRINITY_DN16990_c1_g2::TRINITY_DN16990_c1_g2_i1::g.51754::m.51754